MAKVTVNYAKGSVKIEDSSKGSLISVINRLDITDPKEAVLLAKEWININSNTETSDNTEIVASYTEYKLLKTFGELSEKCLLTTVNYVIEKQEDSDKNVYEYIDLFVSELSIAYALNSVVRWLEDTPEEDKEIRFLKVFNAFVENKE
jgi:hypothetical protein